jgi:hypothetical protein
MKINCLTLLSVLLLTACGGSRDGSEDQLQETVDSFAVSYLNYDFNTARRFCTDDSEKWLQFAASNVLQEDVDILRQQEEPATVDVDEWDYTSDSTASVHVCVHNYLRMDSIGKAGRMTDEGRYVLNAVLHQGKWLIRMADLPRSGKRSHD